MSILRANPSLKALEKARDTMRNTLFLFALITSTAYARSLEDIQKSKVLRVGMRVKDLVYSKDNKQMQHEVAEQFAKDLGVRLEIVEVKEMKDFWSKKGEVKQGETYTPDLFKKVDVYADVLTVNDWRVKLASPAPFLHIKESFLCSIARTSKTMDRIKAGEIPVYTVENSSYHTVAQKLGIAKEQLRFVKATSDLIPAIQQNPNTCVIIDSDQAAIKSNQELRFAGPAVLDNSELAWWTETGNTKLNAAIQTFFRTSKENKTYQNLFHKHYKLTYENYYALITNIGWAVNSKIFK